MTESSAAGDGTLECTTVRAVGLDYVTAEARGQHITDRTMQLPVSSLPNTRMLYAVEFLESVVHNIHACSSSEKYTAVCELEGVKLENRTLLKPGNVLQSAPKKDSVRMKDSDGRT